MIANSIVTAPNHYILN